MPTNVSNPDASLCSNMDNGLGSNTRLILRETGFGLTTWTLIKLYTNISDVRKLSPDEIEEISSKISVDYYFSSDNTRSEIQKLKEPSTIELEVSDDAVKLRDILREDLLTLKKVSKTNLFTYYYQSVNTQIIIKNLFR